MTTQPTPCADNSAHPPILSEEKLRELRSFYEKATQGEWHDFEQFGVKSEVVADSFGNWLLQSWSKLEERFDNDENNRACVIALHNAFPSLLASAEIAERLQSENARLRQLVVDAYREGFSDGAMGDAWSVFEAWSQSRSQALLPTAPETKEEQSHE